jgi:hypothetical protein
VFFHPGDEATVPALDVLTQTAGSDLNQQLR